MLSAPQYEVVNYLKQNANSESLRVLTNKFHKTTIKTMVKKGILNLEECQRLREADMEMVYWTEVKLHEKYQG